jgi:hypothetical protein
MARVESLPRTNADCLQSIVCIMTTLPWDRNPFQIVHRYARAACFSLRETIPVEGPSGGTQFLSSHLRLGRFPDLRHSRSDTQTHSTIQNLVHKLGPEGYKPRKQQFKIRRAPDTCGIASSIQEELNEGISGECWVVLGK